MKKLFYFSKFFLAGFFLLAFNQSCTDLEEDLYSDLTSDNFFKTEEEFVAALGAAYTNLYGYGGNGNIFSLQEVTSDEVIVPTRGNDWDDGGNWRRLHLHTYTADDDRIRDGWNFFFGGINACNRLIFQFQEVGAEGSEAFIAELQALRGLFYWWALDTYGRVPIVDKFDLPEGFQPSNGSRQEVYDFIISTVEAALPNLKKSNDATTYGRMNYYAAQALLANVYLNAEVYTGTAQWSKAVAAADEIINSTEFDIAGNYFDNFNTDNSGSPEFILAIPYDQVFARGFNLPMMTLHYGSQDTYKLTAQPWNGFCSMQEFYESYEDKDLRKGKPSTADGPSGVRGNFIVGPQFASDGSTPIIDSGTEDADPDGDQLTFTAEINEIGPNALRQAGARIGKFEFAIGATDNLSNDFPIFRYSEILLIKAEALWRMNSGDTDALALVNQIRERASSAADPLDPFTSLTAENLLAERGREMFAEAKRRCDLIRFGQYNAAWEFKAEDPSDHVNIFPIPSGQLDANPSLSQNPGY